MDASTTPYFVGPHRHDEPDDPGRPRYDSERELLLDPGEQRLWHGSVQVAGYLLSPSRAYRHWTLDGTAELTVTDRRLAYLCPQWRFSVTGGDAAGGRRAARHRLAGGRQLARPVSGQVLWQWPSRLEILPANTRRPNRLLVVCDALHTIHQPALALLPADERDRPRGSGLAGLARLICRAVIRFRLTNPHIVELSHSERDVLAGHAAVVPLDRPELSATRSVTLPGSLPVEFADRRDYYRRRPNQAVDQRFRLTEPPAAWTWPGSAC